MTARPWWAHTIPAIAQWRFLTELRARLAAEAYPELGRIQRIDCGLAKLADDMTQAGVK